MLAFFPCLDMFSIAPLGTELALAARREVASMSIPTEWLTLKVAISTTTQLIMCARLLPLPSHFLHRPNGMLTAGRVSWQGSVSFAPNRAHTHVPSPLELTLELTDCCARARA